MTRAALQEASTPIRIYPSQVLMREAAPALTLVKTQCSDCHLRELCLPCGLSGPSVQRLDDLKFTRRRVKARQTVYREGDRFHFIYAVRMGTFKSILLLADGREQVSGFYMAGDLMGLDGVANAAHASSVTALEDADICVIPYARLAELANLGGEFQLLVSRLMSREIVREHGLMLLLGSMNAEERLAAFLLNLSRRMKARGFSPSEFHLRMSRAEIGSYLGMTLETVSRTFSAFQERNLLEVERRHIRIADPAGLTNIFESRLH